MEHNEFKQAARRLAKAANTTELASALSRQLGVDVSQLINEAKEQPIDFARSAEWLSRALYGKSWNAVSAEFKEADANGALVNRWLACANEQQAIKFLMARSDLGEQHMVKELGTYNEEPQDDGRGFPAMRVSYALIFDRPGNPQGEYAIYLNGHNGALQGWEAFDENGKVIVFEGSSPFYDLLKVPHPNMNTFADIGLTPSGTPPVTKHGAKRDEASQRMSDFCTTPINECAPRTFRVGGAGGELLIQGELIAELPAFLEHYRDRRKAAGNLTSPSDFTTGFMAAVMAILGEEAASQPGLVLSGMMNR